MPARGDDVVEDLALAAKVRAGDAAAELELCRRLYPRVRAWAALWVRERADVMDLAQEVLLVVLEALRNGKIEQLDRFHGFVAGACRNLATDWSRGDRRRGALLERFGPDRSSFVEPPLPAGKTLEDCLGRLSERHRAIVALTYFAEASAEEIAEQLSTTAGNVRVARHRALGQLQDCLGRST
jgi:DNA-directed RNA polymerase specialized sigma24 family protein